MKEASPSEASIVRACMRAITQWGGIPRKNHPAYGISGDPDIHGCIRGRAFAFEVKRPGRRPTPLQEARLEEWRKAGALVAVLHSAAELDELLIRELPGARRGLAGR